MRDECVNQFLSEHCLHTAKLSLRGVSTPVYLVVLEAAQGRDRGTSDETTRVTLPEIQIWFHFEVKYEVGITIVL